MKATIISAVALVLFGATAVHAQAQMPEEQPYQQPAPQEIDIEEEREEGAARETLGRVGFNFGGVVNAPIDNAADSFDPGFGFSTGINFWLIREVALQAQYTFSYHDVEGDALGAIDRVNGTQTWHQGNINVVVEPVRAGPVSFYLLGGPGLYYRRVELSEASGAPASFCDPSLFVCAPADTAVGSALGSNDSWDFGLNAGIGATVGLADSARLFLEARYNYIWGPEFTDATGRTRDADGQYIPVVLGLAF